MKKHIIKITAIISLLAILVSLTLFVPACKQSDVGNDENGQGKNKTDQQQNIINVDELSIGVICDCHVIAEENLQDVNNPDYVHFIDRWANLKMNELSIPILKTAVDNYIEKGVDIVLMIGDLTLDGAVNSLEVVAEECKRLEDAGITVYVAGGICDFNNGDTGLAYKIFAGMEPDYRGVYSKEDIFCEDISYIATLDDDTKYTPQYLFDSTLEFTETADAETFAETFADYGLNEAISCDTNSLSYACNIPGTNYRLIVIDNASYYSGEKRIAMDYSEADPMPKGQMDWIKDALLDSQSMGKEIIVMTNVPLDPYPTVTMNDFVSDTHITMQEGDELEAMFAKAGVKYIFSGHLHLNAVNEIETAEGTITEIYTSSTTTYPCSIRYFDIAKDYSYTTTAPELGNLKAEYITNTTISQEEKIAASTGFEAFAEHETVRYLENIFIKNTRRRGVMGVHEIALFFFEDLGIYPTGSDESDAALEELSKDIVAWMDEINALPIYGDGDTVEAICKTNGISLPASRYSGFTASEFVMNIFLRMLDNSFELLYDGADSKIFNCIFQVGFLKFCDIDLFGRLHEVNPTIRECDISVMVDDYLKTGNIDLTKDDFILAVLSVLFPMLESNFGLKLNPTNSASLLSLVSTFMPFVNSIVDDLVLFCNDDGMLETESYSLSKGIVYGQKFIENVLFSVLARSCLIN